MDNRALLQWFHDYANRPPITHEEDEEDEELEEVDPPSWIVDEEGPDQLDPNWFTRDREVKKHIPKLTALAMGIIVKSINATAMSEDVDQLDKLKRLIPPNLIGGLLSQLSFAALRKFLQLPSLNLYFENFEYPLKIETIVGCIKQEEDLYRYLYHIHPNHPFIKQTEDQLLLKVYDNYDLFTRGHIDLNNFPVLERPPPDFSDDEEENSNDDRSNKEEENHKKSDTNNTNEKNNNTVKESAINSHEEFNRKWQQLTGGVLQHLNWNNLFVAGGSVLHCLRIMDDEEWHEITDPNPTENELEFVAPLDPERNIELLTDRGYKSVDIDLFIYGLDEHETKLKAREVFESILKAEPRALVDLSRHAMTIFGPTFRPIQLILCLHKSPAEVLLNFDLNCVTVGYDGTDVLCLPKFVIALKYGLNVLDSSMNTKTKLQRQRLKKYAARGFTTSLPIHFRMHGYFDSEVPSNAELASDPQHPVFYYLCEILHLAKWSLLTMWLTEEAIQYKEFHWERFWQTGFTVAGKRAAGPRRNNLIHPQIPLPFKEDQDLTTFTKYSMREVYHEEHVYDHIPLSIFHFNWADYTSGRRSRVHEHLFNANKLDKLTERLNKHRIRVYNDTTHLQPFYMNCCVPTKSYTPDLSKFQNPYLGINTSLATVRYDNKLTDIIFDKFSDIESGRIMSDPFDLAGCRWQLILESGVGKPLVFVHLKLLPGETEDGFSNADVAPFCAANFMVSFKAKYDDAPNLIGFERDIIIDGSMIFTETSDTWSTYFRGHHLANNAAPIIIDDKVTVEVNMQRLSIITPAIAF